MTLEELRAVNRYAESTKSLSYLPQVRRLCRDNDDADKQGSWYWTDKYRRFARKVHERQAARMRTRSEWFLTPLVTTDSDPTALHILRGSNRSSSGNIGK